MKTIFAFVKTNAHDRCIAGMAAPSSTLAVTKQNFNKREGLCDDIFSELAHVADSLEGAEDFFG